jgi:hypothetical protein
MQEESFTDRLNRPVVIDICHQCQAFWFDKRESVALTAAATLALFKLIGDRTSKPGAAVTDRLCCPRCRNPLRDTSDMQKTTRFRYLACPKGDGRFITYFDFLREKEFIKPLTPKQLAELREQVQAVNCSNCGAPVNIQAGAECTHCGSPLSMLDMKHTEKLVAQLQQTASVAQVAHSLREEEIAKMRREAGVPLRYQSDTIWQQDLTTSGLIGAGLHAVARWLSDA